MAGKIGRAGMSAQADTGHKWAARCPGLGTGPVPVEGNVSPACLELECRRVFRPSWLNVARVEDVPGRGDFVVREIRLLNACVVIVRGHDDRIRAFHNVCRHRGNRLVCASSGTAGRFVCDYHGWTYDVDGRLMGVPDEAQFFDLDKSSHGLAPVCCETWNGFIFINLQAQPGEDLAAFLGEMNDRFRDFPFHGARRVATYTAEVRANWKTCMDIGKEAYHVPFVHRASVPDSHAGGDNPLAHLQSVEILGRHAGNSLGVNPHHKASPSEEVVMRFAPTILQGGDPAQALPSCLNPGRAANWGFDVYFIFPNMGLLLGPNWFIFHRYWPITVDQTAWETTLYSTPPRTPGERVSQEFSAILTRDLLREDWAQVEKVQAGLATGAIKDMVFSDQEILVRHGYEAVADAIRRGGPA